MASESGSRATVRQVHADDDLDALNEGNPDWIGAGLTRQLFESADGAPHMMFIGELDGRAAGYAHAVGMGFADGHRGIGALFVRPEFRGNGVGTLLWDAVLSVCTPDAVPGVLLHADATDATSCAIATAHGLRLAGHHIESSLDLAGVDRLRSIPLGIPAGVTIAQFPDDADESTWHDFAELYDALLADAPDNASGSDPMPYDTLRTFLPEPWQVMVASCRGELIGLTCVMVLDNETRRLNTLFTAVARDWRGRGLATALKVSHALALAEAGWTSILTQNMDGNAPILASNRTLGFSPVNEIVDVTFDHLPTVPAQDATTPSPRPDPSPTTPANT
jgi:mycothiol synthase